MAEQKQPNLEQVTDHSGKYHFTIYNNITTNYLTGKPLSHNFKIGGEYADCVNVSILYNKDGQPEKGKIVTAMYDPECIVKGTVPLEHGGGSEIMIKTLMNYIYSKEPTIKIYTFEDDSRIECGTEEEQEQKKRRKRGTHAVPVDLFYFSIAFNGCTWYENHFNAQHIDSNIHEKYKNRVKWVHNNPEAKPDFESFLYLAYPKEEHIAELKKYYDPARTYGEFFESIPKRDRCRLVRSWISTLVGHYMKGYFFQSDWMMDITKMDMIINKQSGGLRNTRKSTRKSKKDKYYCPKGRIYFGGGGMDLGVDEEM